MSPSIDPDSPVPLYHQIAESIRTAIEKGTLRPGEALAPLRAAAEEWGVNVHTVRHAYAALAREGLVEANRGPRGTRVTSGPPLKILKPEPLEGFLEGVLTGALEEHGLTAEDLVEALRRHHAARHGVVYVVECSEWQARCHADEIKASYRVRAIPWTLDRGEPPSGCVVATYFHYNDIRRNWPRRLANVRFVSIHPDPSLRRLVGEAREVWACEREEDTAEAASADLSALFEPGELEVRTKVGPDPAALLPEEPGAQAPHLFAPRVWAEMPEHLRELPHVHELRYMLDRRELDAIARSEGWPELTATTVNQALGRTG